MGAQQDDLLLDSNPYKATIVPVQDNDQRAGTGKAQQYGTALILTLAALAGGTVMGWPSPMGPILTSNDTRVAPLDADGDGFGEPVSQAHFSWLASVNFMVGMVGTLLFGALADRLGRRVAALVVAVPYALSWVLVATTDSLVPLYAARLLGGISCGGTFVVFPLFVAETAQDEHRGALGTFLATGLNTGILVSFVVSTFTTYRTMPLVLLLLPMLYFLCLLRLPETPSFLVRRGRTAAARRSLAWYRGGANVDAELEALIENAKREESTSSSESASLADLVTHRGTRRALVQSLVLLANQQLCGVIAVLSYTEQIFRMAGSTLSPSACSIIVAAVQAVATYLSSFLMDRAGRCTLIIWSNIVMALGLITLGSYLFVGDLGPSWGWLPVLAMSVYVVAFALGVGPVPLVIQAEMYTARARSLATAVGIGVQTMCAFLSTKALPYMELGLGLHGGLWVFAAFCVGGALFTQFVAIETKGKPLDVILAEFHGGLVVPDSATVEADEDDDVFRKGNGGEVTTAT